MSQQVEYVCARVLPGKGRQTGSVSSVVEFQRWWLLESKVFGQESTSSKEIFLKQPHNELWFVKKCQNHTFKVNF